MFKFRVVIALSAMLALVGLTAVPASAASRSLFKESGASVYTYWTQVDGTPVGTAPNGNVHVGALWAMESSANMAYTSLYIDDFDCPAGVLPEHGGHGEFVENGCSYIGSRYGFGENLTLTVDRKLKTASLVGSVTLYGGHGDGPAVGNPAINVTWTGVGSLSKFSSNYRWSDAYGSYSGRYSGQSRTTEMSGTIGPMGFHPDRSGGSIDSYKSMSKSTTK